MEVLQAHRADAVGHELEAVAPREVRLEVGVHRVVFNGDVLRVQVAEAFEDVEDKATEDGRPPEGVILIGGAGACPFAQRGQ